jgi:hypothetical protein
VLTVTDRSGVASGDHSSLQLHRQQQQWTDALQLLGSSLCSIALLPGAVAWVELLLSLLVSMGFVRWGGAGVPEMVAQCLRSRSMHMGAQWVCCVEVSMLDPARPSS